MTQIECHEIFARLSEYLDRELPANLCEKIDEHIADCPPCIEFIRSLEITRELCKDLDLEAEPRPLPDDLLEKLRAAWEKAAPKEAGPDAAR